MAVFLESPYKRLSCICHIEMKRNTAVMLGPIWYDLLFVFYCMMHLVQSTVVPC